MFDSLIDWFNDSGLRILVIVLVTFLISQFGSVIIKTVVRKAIHADRYASEREERLREDTIISILTAVMKIGLWALVVMVLLTELGIDIGPLLAGAGVVGFAVGFGAQSLIKDFLAGMFVILENQYRVGDVVNLNGVSGIVEKISLRATVLRDLDGNVHHLPNGTIELATNKTMEYASVNMNLGVGYETDIDKLEKVVNEVGNKLAEDEKWRDSIMEAPIFDRVNDFGDSAIEIKILGKVEPAMQWKIAGELRRRLKVAFEKEGIEIPFPQRVVHTKK